MTVPTVKSQFDWRYDEAELLLTYMETHCIGLADALWAANKWHLEIGFKGFRMTERALSYQICNKYQSGKELYSSAMRTFLFDHFKTKPLDGKFPSLDALRIHVETHSILSFPAMPNSIKTFSEIAKSRIVKIFAGEKNKLEAVQADPFARRMLCKIMQCVLDGHRRSVCWEGNWSVGDWDIVNGEHVWLLATPTKCTGREQSDKDLNKIATSVLPTFALYGFLPSFMKHLKEELTSLPLRQGDAASGIKCLILSDKDFYSWFYSYLKFHPATMTSLARSTLLQGWYFTMDKLDYRKKSYYHKIFNYPWSVDWVHCFHPPRSVNEVQYGVFWYGKTPSCTEVPHESTYGGLLGYHRHLVQHTPDHGRTKRLKGVYVQSMTNSDEAELIAALHNEELLPEFIKNILNNQMMPCPELLKHWEVYVDTWGK